MTGARTLRNTERVQELDNVVEQLRQRGAPDLAAKVRQVADDLRAGGQPAPMDLITTGEAAELLGVRSINTIKRWVREGLLEGHQRGGRVMVNRASVQGMVDAPPVSAQQAFERDLARTMEAFEGREGDDELPTSDTWDGRKPWNHPHAPAH